MRRAFLLLPLALLVGCREPSFDEEWQAQEKALREEASRIDAEAAKAMPPAGSDSGPRAEPGTYTAADPAKR